MKMLRKIGVYGMMVLCLNVVGVFAQDVQLPAPNLDKPMMQALQQRQSTRAYSNREVSDQTLAELLWAAYDINRPETGGRTTPSAMNARETEIYMLLAKGTYRTMPIITAGNTGYISQKVYVYCAAEGLGTIVRAAMDVAGLQNALKLNKNHLITLT